MLKINNEGIMYSIHAGMGGAGGVWLGFGVWRWWRDNRIA
jgi:hypothetical protein